MFYYPFSYIDRERQKKFRKKLVLGIIIFFVCLNIAITSYIWDVKFQKLNDKISEKTDLEKKYGILQKNISELNKLISSNQKLLSKIEEQTGISYSSDTIPNALGGGEENSYFEKILLANIDNGFFNSQKKVLTNKTRISKLNELIQNKNYIFLYTPTVWPVNGWISSKFGYRNSPFTGKKQFHEGMDISAWPGTKIVSAAAGKVVYAGEKSTYGNFVLIEHKFGYSTAYAHCDKLLVKKGELVKKGQVIATVGNTGQSTGAHLHYEIRINGIPVNPEPYLVKQ